MPSTSVRQPNLDALALFVSVSEEGSVGAAARVWQVSQSAASQKLKALEKDLGVILLDRRTSGSVLTAAGQVVLEWASPLVQAGSRFQGNVKTLAEGLPDRLTVAASLTVAEYLMPMWLTGLRQRLPGVEVSLMPGNSEAVTALVRSRSVELGFIEGPVPPSGLRHRHVKGDELVLVVAPKHRWAARVDGVSASELASGELVLREHGSGTREVLDLALEAHGLHVRPAMQLGSTTAIKSAVGSGFGASVLSKLSVQWELDQGYLVAVPTPELDLTRSIRAIWSGSRRPVGASGALLAISAGDSATQRGFVSSDSL
jgi:DNA-binding transcriptional LysR family regulator